MFFHGIMSQLEQPEQQPKQIQQPISNWGDWLNSDLPITEEIVKQASRFRFCAVGEYLNLQDRPEADEYGMKDIFGDLGRKFYYELQSNDKELAKITYHRIHHETP